MEDLPYLFKIEPGKPNSQKFLTLVYTLTSITLDRTTPDKAGKVSVYVKFPDQPKSDYTLGTLRPGSVDQISCQIPLEGDVDFYVDGKATVCIFGYLTTPDNIGSEDEDEEEEEGEASEANLDFQKYLSKKKADFLHRQPQDSESEEGESEEDESEEEEEEESEEEEEEVFAKPTKKSKVEKTGLGAPQRTPSKEEKNEKKKTQDTPRPTKSQPASTTQRTLPSGLVIQDQILGNGPEAKPGTMVQVYYKGMLKNGTVFDSLTSGKPFTFKLGAGKVIQGWEQGLKGMKRGGKRKLVIPPHLAYGRTGTGPIPPNATLTFEVTLV